jgi:hypothetical protein
LEPEYPTKPIVVHSNMAMKKNVGSGVLAAMAGVLAAAAL